MESVTGYRESVTGSLKRGAFEFEQCTQRSRANVFKCPIDTIDQEKTFEVGGCFSEPLHSYGKGGIEGRHGQASLGQGDQSSNRQVISNPQ